MSKKRLFFLIPILFLSAFLSHAQTEMGLYPLSQYSVGNGTNVQLRTTAAIQNDTLKLPYIEDFTGVGLPIDSMSVDTFSTSPIVLVYRITHLKMHGLKSNDSIRVYNIATTDKTVTSKLVGLKYVNVIDKYSFQLFDNKALTIPSEVLAKRINYLNWLHTSRQGYSSTPDTLGFLDNNGGVFINNDMALNPISIGVATFDGVNYKGIPYSTSTTKGYGDNLTSLPFNLSKDSSGSNIYMSFYWQSKSLGESPISSEFLALEFYDTSGVWRQVWKEMGNQVTADTFKIAMIPITDSLYLHKGFRYRFRSYGVLNGRFSVWNLDYIYINTNRDLAHPFLPDVSIITTSKSALKNYTSIPYKHIKDLPTSTIANEKKKAFMIYRNSHNIEEPVQRQHLIRDNFHNSGINNFGVSYGYDTIAYQIDGLLRQQYIYEQEFKDTIPGEPLMNAPYVLKEEFYFQALDTIGPIDMTFNNFTAIETYFHESYSYDDGTPEVAFISVNPGGTKVSIGYKILKTDELTHVEYCFIKNNGVDLTNSVLRLNVWKEVDGSAPNLIPQTTPIIDQEISIKYSTTINGMVRYELTSPFKLDSGVTYFFGYTQKFNAALFLGYDKNNDHLNQLFFCNDDKTWLNFSTINPTPGSLMIRPVFSDNEVITSTNDKQLGQNQFTFYPNPTKSELHFTGEPEYISIYDLSGLLLVEKKLESTEAISTESLPTGLYLIILSKGDYKEVNRLIIQK